MYKKNRGGGYASARDSTVTCRLGGFQLPHGGAGDEVVDAEDLGQRLLRRIRILVQNERPGLDQVLANPAPERPIAISREEEPTPMDATGHHPLALRFDLVDQASRRVHGEQVTSPLHQRLQDPLAPLARRYLLGPVAEMREIVRPGFGEREDGSGWLARSTKTHTFAHKILPFLLRNIAHDERPAMKVSRCELDAIDGRVGIELPLGHPSPGTLK